MLKMTLEDNGFQVASFNDPILALLILDINMPKMNGFELYTKIKRIDDKVKVCFWLLEFSIVLVFNGKALTSATCSFCPNLNVFAVPLPMGMLRLLLFFKSLSL